jgi:hypothetical protein
MDPYAIFKAGDMTWHVLKTYKQVKNEDAYARWFVAAKSDATFGSFEMGDTYALEVKRYGTLVAATPEWQEAYDTRKVPTPQDYLLDDNNIIKALSEFIA